MEKNASSKDFMGSCEDFGLKIVVYTVVYTVDLLNENMKS